MKKLLGILVLGLLWCNVGSATPDASLTIIVDPSDASCILKKKNKIEKIKPGQKFYVPGFVVPFKTVIYIICKKDGYKTVIDRLKYSKTSPNVGNAAVDAAFDNPVGVVVELLSLNFGTAYLNTDGSPGHGITLLPGEGTLLYRKGKRIKQSDLSKKELKLLKNFLDGKWIDDKSDGQATHTYGTEEEYVGDRINGKKHGQGTLTFADGGKYVGEFKNDKMHGQGTKIWPDGDKYVGEFKDDKANGQGTILFADGQKYVGEFKDNKLHGQGTMTWPNGGKYVGEFKDGNKHGQGTSFMVDGSKYVGEWKDDMTNGQGAVTLPDGTVVKGIFKNNEIVKELN